MKPMSYAKKLTSMVLTSFANDAAVRTPAKRLQNNSASAIVEIVAPTMPRRTIDSANFDLLRFWVAQRFQRCDLRVRVSRRLQPLR